MEVKELSEFLPSALACSKDDDIRIKILEKHLNSEFDWELICMICETFTHSHLILKTFFSFKIPRDKLTTTQLARLLQVFKFDLDLEKFLNHIKRSWLPITCPSITKGQDIVQVLNVFVPFSYLMERFLRVMFLTNNITKIPIVLEFTEIKQILDKIPDTFWQMTEYLAEHFELYITTKQVLSLLCMNHDPDKFRFVWVLEKLLSHVTDFTHEFTPEIMEIYITRCVKDPFDKHLSDKIVKVLITKQKVMTRKIAEWILELSDYDRIWTWSGLYNQVTLKEHDGLESKMFDYVHEKTLLDSEVKELKKKIIEKLEENCYSSQCFTDNKGKRKIDDLLSEDQLSNLAENDDFKKLSHKAVIEVVKRTYEFTFESKERLTVGETKQRISKERKIPTSQMKLTCRGKELDDSSFLPDTGVQLLLSD